MDYAGYLVFTPVLKFEDAKTDGVLIDKCLGFGALVVRARQLLEKAGKVEHDLVSRELANHFEAFLESEKRDINYCVYFDFSK